MRTEMTGRAFEILSVVGILVTIVAGVLAINREIRQVSDDLERTLRATIDGLEERIDVERGALAEDIEQNRDDIAMVRERTWSLARSGETTVTLKATNQDLFRALLGGTD